MSTYTPSIEYLAGLFDGEGCIDVQRMQDPTGKGRFYVRPRVRVCLADSGRSILEALHREYGGHLARRKPPVQENWQTSSTWELLSGDDMRRMLSALEPHLVLKREQARLALWWLTENPCRQRKGHDFSEARKVFAAELSAMKKDIFRSCESAVQAILGAVRVDATLLGSIAK